MTIMQPQDKPRGTAMILCKAVCRALERENRKRKFHIPVHITLRALEWTRYCITEACVDQLGEAAARAGGTHFKPVSVERKSRKNNGGLESQ